MPFAGWYDKWDATQPAGYPNQGAVLDSLGRQFNSSGQIMNQDFGSNSASFLQPTMSEPGRAASPILEQIRNKAKINQRDFGAQTQTPVPSPTPASYTPAFTAAYSAEPDRTGRVAAPTGAVRPSAYYAQGPQRRYGLKSSGSSTLLDALKPKTLFGG